MASRENIVWKRGDNFPIDVILKRDKEWTLVGSVIDMTIEFKDGIKHKLTGTLKNDALANNEKLVSFVPITSAIETIRRGIYDVQVNDGTYKATHLEGVFDVKKDVSVWWW